MHNLDMKKESGPAYRFYFAKRYGCILPIKAMSIDGKRCSLLKDLQEFRTTSIMKAVSEYGQRLQTIQGSQHHSNSNNLYF